MEDFQLEWLILNMRWYFLLFYLILHRKANNIFSYQVTRKMHFKLSAQTFVVTNEIFILFVIITSRLI